MPIRTTKWLAATFDRDLCLSSAVNGTIADGLITAVGGAPGDDAADFETIDPRGCPVMPHAAAVEALDHLMSTGEARGLEINWFGEASK